MRLLVLRIETSMPPIVFVSVSVMVSSDACLRKEVFCVESVFFCGAVMDASTFWWSILWSWWWRNERKSQPFLWNRSFQKQKDRWAVLSQRWCVYVYLKLAWRQVKSPSESIGSMILHNAFRNNGTLGTLNSPHLSEQRKQSMKFQFFLFLGPIHTHFEVIIFCIEWDGSAAQ